MKALERYLSRAVLGRAPRRTRKPRKRGMLALCLDYVKFPERDEKYKAWIRTLPCCITGCITECNRGRIEAAHTGSDGGMRLKASDRSCVPLCHYHHAVYYHGLNAGKRTLEALHAIDFRATVERLNQKYDRR